ncbi:MAG: hypothetical protein QM493_10860, partial [Sulfurovum sp.]
ANLSNNIILKLVQRQDKLVSSLIIISLMLAGLLTTYFLYNIKNIRDDRKASIEELKEILLRKVKTDLDKEIKKEVKDSLDRDAIIKEIKTSINSTIAKEVRKDIDNIFKNEYNDIISNYVNAKVEEVIMKTPESRDMLSRRLRRMNKDISELFENKSKNDIADDLYKIINRSIDDWGEIGKLYSISDDRDNSQLISSLQYITSNPFIEAKTHLEKLKQRYEEDIQLFHLITCAINAIDRV